jgi:hypothetical protein
MRGFLSFLTAYIATVQCANLAEPHAIRAAPTVSLVYQFPTNGSWIENLAVRSNGKIVITRADIPELWSIDPSDDSASLIHTFPNATGIQGITEIQHDVFAIAVGILPTADAAASPGSWVIWRVDLNPRTPTFAIITAIPEALFLNGLTTVNDHGLVLIADSYKGVIWSLDTNTAAYSIALSDSTMLPLPLPNQLGVNGVKLQNGYAYYTSTSQQKFCRVRVSSEANATGSYEVVASGFGQDDFAFAQSRTPYIATHPQDSVAKVIGGQVFTIAGSNTTWTLAGSTSAQFGYTEAGTVLYVTTNGGVGFPVLGRLEPGKIVKISGIEW